jgi:transposase
MSKRRYKEGIDRQQSYLLPPKLDEYVSEDNPVRVIDVYVDSLDLEGLGFKNTAGELSAGQPAFPPKALLKLYLYGYLHRVRSSRRLEQECQRNLEVIWLMEGLRPGYKTIADFRKDNLEALKAVNRDFVQLCKELDLFGGELVSLDGSFFRGNVGKKRIFTEQRLKKGLEQIEKHISKYLQALDQSDAEEAEPGRTDPKPDLQEKLAQLRERQREQQLRLLKLQASGEKQLAEVDEDARLLHKNGQTVAGYNVEAAVDAKNKLFVVAEATQEGNDEQQLEPLAKAAKAELERKQLEPEEEEAQTEPESQPFAVTADAGFFNAQQIKNCVEAGIIPYVPEPEKTNQASLQGRFVRDDFSYCADTNSYTCPAGEELRYKKTHTTPYRQVTRWEHEDVIDAHRQRMAEKGREMMHQRACLSEHPFGTLKLSSGWTHFLLRGLNKVQAELSLMMWSYNFKRVLNILGLEALRTYCLQRA